MMIPAVRMRCLTLFALFLACGGCKRGAHRVNQRHIPDSQRTVLGPGPTPVRLEVVPSSGNCAPKEADNLVILGACCNDTACGGQCVRGAESKIECACFEVKGGCPAGQVCSRVRRRCVKLEEAQLP